MIKWCSYCQQFQGEEPPFETVQFTHGMCDRCYAQGLGKLAEKQETTQQLAGLARRLWSVASEGRGDLMPGLLDEAVAAGFRPIDILYGIAGPSLVEIGRLWETNRISVAEEHRFTASCEQLVNEVARHVTEAEGQRDARILLAPVPGNRHTLGTRFVQIGLAGMGLTAERVDDPATPDALVARAVDGGYRAVGLSVSISTQTAELGACLAAFDAEPRFDGTLLVGGAAVNQGMVELAERSSLRVVVRPRFGSEEPWLEELRQAA